MEQIKLWIAKILLHKYLPITYIVKGYDALSGYRTQIFAVLWVLVYELGKNHVGLFSDPDLTQKALEYLAGGASITLLEKFKSWLPLVDQTIQEGGKIK